MLVSLSLEPPVEYAAPGLPDAAITEKIHYIRGQKVMLDRDLAELYGVETKALKRAVRRNLDRFPQDFMFELTTEEFENWRYQFGTSNSGDRMGLRYLPMAFTEHGILMLANVLRSEQAIAVSIHIIRVFTRMREVLLNHKDILLKLEQLERQVHGHDQEIQVIFDHLKHLLTAPPAAPRPRIGYKKDSSA